MTEGSSLDRGFGRYRLRYRLARGGMASVYLAQVQGPGGFEKWVAVKAVHPHLSDDSKFVRMFLDEARLTARLSHPNICAVFDFGEADGVHYIAMEYLRGESFSSVVNRGIKGQVMPPELVARLVADAARGLHSAHDAVGDDGEPLNIVHRDVSPQNIFVLYDGIAKVVDFGIARARDRLADTATDELKGKIAYMAPEQLGTRVVDRRTDVFSLGVVLWEATVLRRLFKREATAMTVAALLHDPIPRPSELRPGFPPALDAIVTRALEREPAARFQSMEEMADALDEFILSTQRPAGAAQVAAWMRATFADRIERSSAALRAELAVDGAVVDLDPSASRTVAFGGSRSSVDVPPSGRRRVVPLAVVAGVLLVAATAFGGWHLGRRGERATVEAGTLSVAGAAPERVGLADAGAQGGGPGEPNAADRPPEATRDARASEGDASPDEQPAGRVEREPARRTAPATAPDPGYLNLISVPVAEVWLGGRSLGTTPLQKVHVSAGRHRLKLRAVRGEGKLGRTVTIRPREVTYLSVRLEP